MNYSQLKAAISDYAHRSDLTAQIPDFITLAQRRIERDIRIQEMVFDTEIPVTENPWPLPDDFLELKELSRSANNSTGSIILSSVGRHQLVRYTGATGDAPLFYCITGRQIECQPNGSDRTYRMVYYAKPAELNLDSDTNSVLTRYPNLYLYGALIELFSWTQDNQQQARVTEMYTSEVMAANEASDWSDTGESLQMSGASAWV